MAYTINYTDITNKGSIVIEDNTVDTSTSLSIPGRFTTDYGTLIGQNFLQLLENFSNTTAPQRPVEGQLWYDTSIGVNILKIYDGTNWIEAGGLKRGESAPDVANSVAGDLWADTDNQQLYLYTGSGWILVGPEFSDGLAAGVRPSTLTGTDNVNYTALKVEIGGKVLAIYATSAFTPKATIQGFSSLKAGFNMSSADITGAGVAKYYGIAEKAESLIIAGEANPVSAENFLRGDKESISSKGLIIRNNSGVQVGSDAVVQIGIEGQNAIISNNTSGANIDLRINNAGNLQPVIRIDSTQKVGINNLSPAEALDVTGNAIISNNLIINGIAEAVNISTGAITTKGGLGVAKSARIGNELEVGSTATFGGSLLPDTSNTRSIGSAILKFAEVNANTFKGNLVGNVTGTVTGRSGSSDKLASRTTFQVTGDVTAPNIIFDGQYTAPGETTLVKTFDISVNSTFVTNKPNVPTSRFDDELLINRLNDENGSGTGLKKISRSNLFSALPVNPVGMIVPYAGDNSTASDLNGWLLCDGREEFIVDWPQLYEIIGTKYKANPALGKFALPDLRGRFPLGQDNMGTQQGSANRVTDANADTLGGTAGFEKKPIKVENLPEHEHDLRGPSGTQYYVSRDVQGTPVDADATVADAPTGTNAGQKFPFSGGVVSTTTVGQDFDIMNPYLAVNYLIYAGAK
jgi:microcystin-dependent protein/cytoskeletal protein CcmA (bactofilin family)